MSLQNEQNLDDMRVYFGAGAQFSITMNPIVTYL
jgi:hypothetical protein